ncbi:hypothetical protein OGAPHI_003036 [Ogataea philodendri]|uniref:Uncharacterized protein n=1 Tax=Ogataea philodendri TaxID=1378263 RepID=A0A9P8P8S3_9ASCO|nr:uncharacterized protein OGAPHI_003036 [Ogataea philodendri]KAH3667387.1 hypothetical protein OGAPHI_003036 [Ogataea philodendri]
MIRQNTVLIQENFVLTCSNALTSMLSRSSGENGRSLIISRIDDCNACTSGIGGLEKSVLDILVVSSSGAVGGASDAVATGFSVFEEYCPDLTSWRQASNVAIALSVVAVATPTAISHVIVSFAHRTASSSVDKPGIDAIGVEHMATDQTTHLVVVQQVIKTDRTHSGGEVEMVLIHGGCGSGGRFGELDLLELALVGQISFLRQFVDAADTVFVAVCGRRGGLLLLPGGVLFVDQDALVSVDNVFLAAVEPLGVRLDGEQVVDLLLSQLSFSGVPIRRVITGSVWGSVVCEVEGHVVFEVRLESVHGRAPGGPHVERVAGKLRSGTVKTVSGTDKVSEGEEDEEYSNDHPDTEGDEEQHGGRLAAYEVSSHVGLRGRGRGSSRR